MRAQQAIATTAPEPPSRASSLALIGGALCLDFANTSSGRGTALRLEHLRQWEHLLAWAEHVGMIDADGRRRLEVAVLADPSRGRAALGRALSLREAIHAIFRSLALAEDPPAPAMGILNRNLSRAMAAAEIAADGGGFAWRWPEPWTAPGRLLWPIAYSAAQLLTSPELKRVKMCPGHGCGWLFIDRTRNGRRRWCEMEVCGSRNKMRRYHQRRRAAATGAS